MHLRALIVGVASSLAAAALWPALIVAQSTPDTGLHVEGAVAESTVAPGKTHVHHMVVSLGAGAPAPMDIVVDARGLGQGPDGSPLPLLPEEDQSPYSARVFIKNIDATTFRL